MADLKVGDRVIINYATLATLTFFDRKLDRWAAEQRVGGSVNTFSGHVSNTRFEPLEPIVADAVEDKRETDNPRDGIANVGETDLPTPDAHSDVESQRVGVNHSDAQAEAESE